MVSKRVLLKRAEEQFLKKDYDNALKIYSLLLKDYPQLKDAKVGAFLSDMGLDSDEEAQALFSYYQMIKDLNEDADMIIDELMQAIYSTRVIVQNVLLDSIEQMSETDGISYGDFLDLVEDKGSFRETFEDMMFSGRIVIRSREEFIDFIKRLAEAGYDDIALNYLDNLSENFGNDQEIYALYGLFDKRDGNGA